MAMSVMEVFPVPGLSKLPSVFTISLVKATEPAAAVALVERKTPRNPLGGTRLPSGLQPAPEMPVAVETKIVAAFVGSTRMFVIDLPVKQL